MIIFRNKLVKSEKGVFSRVFKRSDWPSHAPIRLRHWENSSQWIPYARKRLYFYMLTSWTLLSFAGHGKSGFSGRPSGPEAQGPRSIQWLRKTEKGLSGTF